MPEYRRYRVPGGTYFFTLALADRRTDLLVREITALRAAVVRTRLRHPFQIDAWVVLPEHMHAVWTLPENDADYGARWSLIKRWFSATIIADETRSASRVAKGERGIWQRRFWEHTIRDADDFARHVDYVHFNPVKHGLVARAVDWPHSSFKRAVARGNYPPDWAQANDVGAFGEVGIGSSDRTRSKVVGCARAPHPTLAGYPKDSSSGSYGKPRRSVIANALLQDHPSCRERHGAINER